MTIGGDSVNSGSASNAATKQPTAATAAKITDFGIFWNGNFLKGEVAGDEGKGVVQSLILSHGSNQNNHSEQENCKFQNVMIL